MKNRLTHLTPSIFELVAGVFVTLVIIFLANSKQLLSYYGLQTSDQLIKSNAGDTLNSGLKVIDSFSATNGVVTFMIWAVVGVVCFGIVEAIGRSYHELQFEKQLSSRRYIHPSTFTKAKFWRGVLVDTVTLAIGLLLLALAAVVFMLVVMPVGLAYTRVFLFNVSIMNVLYMLLGVVIIFSGIFVLNGIIRFLIHRRRILKA